MALNTAGTFTARPKDVVKSWVLIDAKGLVLGRLASIVAKMLRGKDKCIYTPNIDTGSNIIIINAEQVALTGDKLDDRVFYWHTGHPGGVKERTMKEILTSRFPDRVIKKAVERMMPKESPLARKQMKSLYVYAGDQHPHQGQTPVVLDIAAKNRKNKR
jgi:large subunit ribosomal protein L13